LTSLASAVDHLSLPAPDVESLRFYLTLPMYHEFKNSKNATILQVPYAEALLYLKNTDLRTIGKIYEKCKSIIKGINNGFQYQKHIL